jgi:hypothetical protein
MDIAYRGFIQEPRLSSRLTHQTVLNKAATKMANVPKLNILPED